MEKKCSKCNIPKSLDEFNKRSNSKDGLRFECKACQKLHYDVNRDHYITKMKENRLNNLDDYTKRDKDYYEANRTTILEKKQKYHIDNQESILKKAKLYYTNNKDKRSFYNKNWAAANILHLREYRKQYSKEYREKYPHIILWRSVLSCLKRLGKHKEGKSIDLLGYSASDLYYHMIPLFTEGMSWDNQGKWHIDHIKPVSKFNPDTPMNMVNALANLQPLWGIDNIKKGAKITIS